ncbi:MAG: hypothetical protein ACI4XM_06640, partial [Candidatus Coprovivens sp.]
MLDFDTALELLNKYGYTSIQVHPYIYQDGDTIGICYTYVDEEFGLLERIKIFNNAAEFEDFLKMYNWVQVNGKLHHVRMILDNYESINPKVMFLRNEKIMVEGEMFDIDAFDSREAMRVNMDPVSKVIYECGDLLLLYNEIKNRQLQYLKNIIKLKNSLRHKYYDLQIEVDKYNKNKVERVLKLLPEIADSGINEMMEVSIKDKYNLYITQRPSYEEALTFLKEIWELCLSLELNTKYYEAQKEENDIRNEMKVVDQKLTLMRTLNDELKPLFGTDLMSKFRKINRVCKSESTTISNEFISQQIDAVNRKYSYFDKIDTLYTSDYLREAVQNSNYEDLAIKYATGASFDVISKYKTPLNEIAVSLSIQYRDKLSAAEQSMLVLYNNPKYRILCDTILNLDNFDTIPIKSVMKAINGIKGLSKIKTECYEIVKKRIEDPVNQKLKNSLFASFDFTTFESFISSLVKGLSLLKVVNEKMVLSGDINMYISVNKVDELGNKKYVVTTNDLQGLISTVKDTKKMIGITLLKEGTPVLYSPYYFDVGDIYTKGGSLEMYIKEMVNFELLIDISDIIINVDPNKTIVAKYYTIPNVVENLSIVDDIKMSYKTTFCKYALTSKLSNVVTFNQSQSVASNVSPVVSSVIDAGALASIPNDSNTDVKNVENSNLSNKDVVIINESVVNNEEKKTVNTAENKIEENKVVTSNVQAKNEQSVEKKEPVNKVITNTNSSVNNNSITSNEINKKESTKDVVVNTSNNVASAPVKVEDAQTKVVSSNSNKETTGVSQIPENKKVENKVVISNVQVKSEQSVENKEPVNKVITNTNSSVNSNSITSNEINKNESTKDVVVNTSNNVASAP